MLFCFVLAVLVFSWTILEELLNQPNLSPYMQWNVMQFLSPLRSWILHRELAWKWPLCSPREGRHIDTETCEGKNRHVGKSTAGRYKKCFNKETSWCCVSFLKGKILAYPCALFPLGSRFLRRIRRILSLRLGCNTFPVENLTDTFSTHWMSLSNAANSSVSVNFLKFKDLLIWGGKIH